MICETVDPHKPHQFESGGLWWNCNGNLPEVWRGDDEPHKSHVWIGSDYAEAGAGYASCSGTKESGQ